MKRCNHVSHFDILTTSPIIGGMKSVYRRISSNIKNLLKAKGLTMEGLAFEAEINKGNLSRILSGKGGASLDLLRKIADSLKVDIQELFKP